MAYRAEKSGFAREAEGKMLSKWDRELAVTSMHWVQEKTGMPLPDGFSGEMDETHAYLKDGFVLAKLSDWVKPGSIAARMLAKPPTMTFKQMELISLFLKTVNAGYVQDTELFQTVDLYEKTNMPMVIFTIGALGRKLQGESRGFGKAESIGEKKNWTEEQLKAGQNVIGLQMGTNQGASQKGLNMGKTRAIMD